MLSIFAVNAAADSLSYLSNSSFVSFIKFSIAALIVIAGLAFAWTRQSINSGNEAISLVVTPGSSARQIASDIAKLGAESSPVITETLWWLLLRFSGQSRSIKAGEYEVEPGTQPARLLTKLIAGEQVTRQITLVEGWTFRQILDALKKQPRLKSSIQGLPDEDAQRLIMRVIGKPDVHPEGRFFPDTYSFSTGQTDIDVLRRAALAMDKQLALAWGARDANTVLQSPDDALILASIVEKETGNPNDRGQISGVFHNRLRIGMRLQTDPTVIYGLGSRFDGNLRKRDLLADTPYNTYTRAGLPPTPIATPGKAALEAAVKPAATNAMYFVAKGDGSSAFSATLVEHNRAVDQYIRLR